MRAITLTQPWAGLVAAGIKLLENRRRPIIPREPYGKPVAIHASREIDDDVYDRIEEIAPELQLLPSFLVSGTVVAARKAPEWYRLSRITGAVIAVGTPIGTLLGDTDPRFGDCALDDPRYRRWYFGPVAHLFRDDMRALAAPVPCRGMLGCWTLPADVERQVRAQIAEAA